jgi:hypothetical protein
MPPAPRELYQQRRVVFVLPTHHALLESAQALLVLARDNFLPLRLLDEKALPDPGRAHPHASVSSPASK